MTNNNLNFIVKKESTTYSLDKLIKGVLSSLAISSLLLFSGCGGGGNSSDPIVNTDKTGQLLDSAVAGVAYTTNSKTGITNSSGTFTYSSSDTSILFKIGNLTLADFNLSNINSDSKVFPTDLVGVDRNNTTDANVSKMLRLLQSLDDDGNISEGININTVTANLLTTTINIVDMNITALNTMVVNASKILKSEEEARSHFESTLNSVLNLNLDTVAPNIASLTNDINQTQGATTSIEVNGEVGAKIFLDGIDTNLTIGLSGKTTISLDTNATIGSYNTFTITLKDSKNNISQSLDFNITKQETVNNTPTIDISYSNFSLYENNGTSNYDINISDIDGDTLTLRVESNNTNILTVTQNWTNDLTQASYRNQILDFNLTTVTDSFGIVKITITVDDADKNSITSFDINITDVIDVFQSGDSWKGITYNTVASTLTQKVWLDRNLGALQVCTAYNDTNCYGDYYQWGRESDGHENNNSLTSSIFSDDLIVSNQNIQDNNGSFIKNTFTSEPFDWLDVNNTNVDDNGSIRSANWSKIDGSSICPIGFRVPTIDELKGETMISQTEIQSKNDAFNGFLKLPSAGQRDTFTGNVMGKGEFTNMWSSTVNEQINAKALSIYENSEEWHDGGHNRASGFVVRCIKD